VPTTATVTRVLKVDLTQDELRAKLEEHLDSCDELREAEEAKKVAMRQHNEIIKRLKAQECKLAAVCAQRWENRDVECIVEFHQPVVGMKRIVRTDTGEVVEEMQMSDLERQENLFEEKAQFEEVVCDVPPPNPYQAPDEAEPEKAEEPKQEIRITEVPSEEQAQPETPPNKEAGSEIVGTCHNCGKDIPKFAMDEGKCAICDVKLPKCETCGGYLFDEKTRHSLEVGQCGPRPLEVE
jgi:hypothetical protein